MNALQMLENTNRAQRETIQQLTAELKAGAELLALVAKSIVQASDLLNADPAISKHFTKTTRMFAEIVEFAREHAEKPSGAIGALDDRWTEINRQGLAEKDAEIAGIESKVIERCAKTSERLHDQDCGDIAEYCFAGRQIATAIRKLAKPQVVGS